MTRLRVEDGAEFQGLIEFIKEGEWRASCFARIDRGSSIDEEEPEILLFATEEEADKWIDDTGRARGFIPKRWETRYHPN